jgi:16S rRNA processing protein RimM
MVEIIAGGRAMQTLKNPVQMAVIGAAHGIRGELRVKSFTGDPLALADYGPLFARDGRAFTILDIRPANTVVVVRFKGVSDRGAAEALTGTELFVDRAVLPDDADSDSFYHADLIGLEARDESGVPLGKIIAVQNFGGGDLLEITMGGRHDILIPFTAAAVPEVSIVQGFVRIDSLAAGLFDGEPAEGGEETGLTSRPRGPKGAGGNR